MTISTSYEGPKNTGWRTYVVKRVSLIAIAYLSISTLSECLLHLLGTTASIIVPATGASLYRVSKRVYRLLNLCTVSDGVPVLTSSSERLIALILLLERFGIAPSDRLLTVSHNYCIQWRRELERLVVELTVRGMIKGKKSRRKISHHC